MRRLLVLILTIVLLPIALPTALGEESAPSVWTLSTLERASVIDGIPAKMPQGGGADVRLYALKGEVVSFQVVMPTLDAPYDITDLTVSDFSGASTIPASDVTLYREYYQFIPSGVVEDVEWIGSDEEGWTVVPVSEGRHSNLAWDGIDPDDPATTNKPETLLDMWVPDALIPFVDQKGDAIPQGALYSALPCTVEPNKNAAFWVDVKVPRDIPAGEYAGTYMVKTSLGNTKGSITLTVWDCEMPETSALYTSVSLKPAGDYSDYQHELDQNINTSKELLNHRINVSNEFAPEVFAELMPLGQRYAEAGFWGNASWGVCDMDDAPESAAVTERAQTLRAALGDDVRITAYVADEIEYAYDGITADWDDQDEEHLTAMAQAHDKFRQKLYDWKRVLNENGVEMLLVCKPYRDMLDDSDLGGTGEPLADIFVVLDSLWDVPYPAHEPGDSAAELAKLAQEKGSEIWHYTALIQDGYTPQWQLDYAPINFRIAPGFMEHALGGTGYLYWTANAWSNDPWNDAWISAYSNAIGDGVLVYPGTEAGIEGVVPSIRLKNMRDGIYDYDYIELAKSKGLGKEAADIVAEVATGHKDWTQDPATLIEARIKLGTLLDKAQ